MAQPGPAMAVLGAMPEEIAALLEALDERTDERIGAFDLHKGSLEGQPVLLAHCGIGKVNAAALAQMLIMQEPRGLIFTGVAGAADPSLAVGDIVVATDAIQHDVDVTALGYEPGRVPGEPLRWRCDPRLVELGLRAAAQLDGVRVVAGTVASGDQFVADEARTQNLHRSFGASCIEMEGAAVAQVCSRARVPFVIIRSMSDSADHAAGHSFREFTSLAAARAKALVREMLRGEA